MNIFLLHEEPDDAAKAVCDKHCGKMCLEATQIANTGLHLAGEGESAFYSKTHTGHPWCEFAAKSFDHFEFVIRHAQALGREFLRRYDSRHSSHHKIVQHWSHDDMRAIERGMGRANWETVWEDIPQAMPESYQQDNPIAAYREYYRAEKWSEDWCKYERVECPEWFASPRNRW